MQYFARHFIIMSVALVLTGSLLFVGESISGTPKGPSGPSNGVLRPADPASTGPWRKCTYTSGLSGNGYSSAIVYYPCTGPAPFSGTTLTGGYTNTKEDMDWLGSHLVTHGFIIIAMTPINTLGDNGSWKDAHRAGIAMLKAENDRSASPIYGKVNTGALQVMGFSKGGGGALLASSELGPAIKSTQVLAPYMDSTYDLSGIRSATICYTGTADICAIPRDVVAMFDHLPIGIDRCLAYFKNVSHTDWCGRSGNHRDIMRRHITSWMKVYLDGNTAYNTYLDGSQDWFYRFVYSLAGFI